MKRRIITFLAAVLAAAVFTGCMASKPTGTTGITDREGNGIVYNARHFRYEGIAEFPEITVLRSREELEDFCRGKDHRGIFYQEDGQDLSCTLQDALGQYDEAYFESKYLILVFREEPSGSIRHQVTDVKWVSGGQLEIYIRIDSPPEGTCDMACFHILLELDKSDDVQRSENVTVYFADGVSTLSVFHEGTTYSVPEGNAQSLEDLLTELAYDPDQICDCAPEYTLKTADGIRYELNLTEGFARCGAGQAWLEDAQTEMIRVMIQDMIWVG